MGGDSRLNLLLTHEASKGPKQPFAPPAWYQTLSRMLEPLGVRTFEATSGKDAVELIEKHPIHLAVVDSRLPAISGINVLRLIQKLRESGSTQPPTPPSTDVRVQMRVEEKTDGTNVERRIEVRFDARPAARKPDPTVILIAPQQDQQLMQEALRFNAFTVLNEPVDVNLMLEVMARALRRFHQNQWPV